MGTDMMVMVEVSHADEEGWHPLRGTSSAYEAPRNYVMFAMLADVCNRSGRVERTWQEPTTVTDNEGVDHEMPGWWYDPDNGGHDRLEPIALPRGIPDDASVAWRANVVIWEARRQFVVTSYLSPEEILAADWDQEVWREGYLAEEDYLAWRDQTILPESFAAEAGGSGLRTVTVEEYEAGVRGENSTAVWLRWNAGTARNICREFLDMVAGLGELKAFRPSSNLRFMVLFEC